MPDETEDADYTEEGAVEGAGVEMELEKEIADVVEVGEVVEQEVEVEEEEVVVVACQVDSSTPVE